MTSPLVRPRFLKGSVVAFVLLLPFVVLEGWDYMETRRLATSIAKIRERHEPVITQDMQPFVIPHGESADASRYYRAAATLVGLEWDEEQRTKLRARVTDAMWSDIWPEELMADLRARVGHEGEALGLMDRAAPLRFEGFGSGFYPRFGFGDITTLMRVAPLRTRLQALDGNGNAAASSLVAELRLQRVMDFGPGPGYIGYDLSGLVDTLRLVVNHSHPDGEALSRIASSLREMDRDDRLKWYLLRSRASLLDRGNNDGIEFLNAGRVQSLAGSAALMRPLMMARLIERIETLNALIDNAAKPWPERMEPPRSAYVSDTPRSGSSRLMDANVMAGLATNLALIRSARVVVAVEQFRLAHGGAWPAQIDEVVPHLDAIPIDPFSGKPMRFVAEERGYVVYSFGRNLRDDGGQLPVRSAFPRPTPGAPTPANDLGIRITQR